MEPPGPQVTPLVAEAVTTIFFPAHASAGGGTGGVGEEPSLLLHDCIITEPEANKAMITKATLLMISFLTRTTL